MVEASRRNSFDLVRIFAAGCVLWSHQFALLGLSEPKVPVFDVAFGGLGVWIFFAVSGYLNARSLLVRKSLPVFLLHRALRIYPALIGCIAVMVVGGAVLSSASPGEYFWGVRGFVLRNATLVAGSHQTLPGLFVTNPIPILANGSLWTLPYESYLYLALAILLAICRYSPAALIGLFCLTIAAAVIQPAKPALLPTWIESWLSMYNLTVLAMLFAAGAFVAACEKYGMVAVGLGVCCILSATAFLAGDIVLARHFAIVVLAIALGGFCPPKVLYLKADVSYGVYLYAFFVQQVVAMFVVDFWFALTLSVSGTTVLALASWFLIERPFLMLKSWRPGRSVLRLASASPSVPR